MSKAVKKAMNRFNEVMALRQCAESIEAAMPVIQEMFEAFPYAEKEDDDKIMENLANAGKAAREQFNRIVKDSDVKYE